MRIVAVVLVVVLAPAGSADLTPGKGAFVADGSLPSPHATQAAAADATSVYAISSTAVVRHDRATGRELARSSGKAEHLNSGFLWQGKLYCAHSNYPRRPHQSDIRVLDPKTMRLELYHRFDGPPGSLTWAVRRGDHWWCHFAHYGKDNARSVLVRYDQGWKEAGRWSYPPALIADLGSYSLSGGLWRDDDLLTTGHDKKRIYRLRLPREGTVVELVEVLRSPFPGQGIAADPVTGGLVGIDRGKQQVVFARLASR